MSLLILKPDVDGRTGQIRFRVQVEEKDAAGKVSRGPMETIAIYPRALTNILGDKPRTAENLRAALRAWMQPQHDAMLERKRMIESVTAVAAELTGKTVEFE